jgi:hypothetical protein
MAQDSRPVSNRCSVAGDARLVVRVSIGENMGSFGSSKSSDTATFSGFSQPSIPLEQTSGTQQVGGFADVTFGKPFQVSVPEAVAGVARVTVSGVGVTQVGGPGQYAVSLSLAQAQSVQLTGGNTDAQNSVTSGPGTFTYRSRNTQVATVSAGGLVTPVGRGQAEILVGYPTAQVNLWTTSGNDQIYASLIVTVLP